MNDIQYETLADGVKLEDIATDINNRIVLRRIMRNDINSLYIQNRHDDDSDDDDSDNEEDGMYYPEGTKDMGWLGYFSGKNDQLKELCFKHFTLPSGISIAEVLEPFFKGVINNKSIHTLNFDGMDLLDGRVFTLMDPFLKSNTNLDVFHIENCLLAAEGSRLLALAIGSCTNLREISIISTDISDEGLVDIITSLSMHPHLHYLDLDGNQLQTNGCKALSTLLKCSVTKLETLDLCRNEINDEGIDALVPALKSCYHLKSLVLNTNQSITSRGWQQLATILETPNSSLTDLPMMGNLKNNTDDETLAIFARSLITNHTMKRLSFSGLTPSKQGIFSKLICDTSSVNATFLSNHTLSNLGYIPNMSNRDPMQILLDLNHRKNKEEVAIIKILQHHNDFDMTPFFEWEFKVLPLMIDWFTRASSITIMPVGNWHIRRVELSSIYQFVRGMPLLYVETRLRKELEDIKASRAQMKEERISLDHRERGLGVMPNLSTFL